MNNFFRMSTLFCAVAFFVSGVLAADGPGTLTGSKKPRIELGTSAAFAPDGTLFAVSKQGDHLMLSRSTDDGASWQTPVMINAEPEPISAAGDNRPKLAVAPDGSIYVAWTRQLAKPYTGEIRFARSDDGKTFSPPVTVHQDRSEITHAFESMVVAGDGRIVLAWIDKRDSVAAKASKLDYRGAAIYFAISSDGGRSFQPERKIADHACECCRIAATVDKTGAPLFMWRHVFEPNERDHALVRIDDQGRPGNVMRATFDKWRLDGCPHHGPSIVVDAADQRHAVWFNHKNGEGRVFYGRLAPIKEGKEGLAVANQREIGSVRAERADLSVSGQRVSLIWKEFDGERTHLLADISEDGGQTFKTTALATSAGASDQPRSLLRGEVFYAFWRSEREGMRVFRLP
jgi:hypothetical protein